jgi:thiosulfate/3-mercaptopyruvate sulfurtransferase
MRPTLQVSELAALLDGDPATRPVLLDVRYKLGGPPGRPEYEAGHIPGAQYVDLDEELAGKPGAAGRHPLPDLDVFTAAMRRAGVGPGTDVVTYDGWLGWSAARAWWLLRWAGHDRVRVLDGGLQAWTAAGLPLESGERPAAHGDFIPSPGALPTLDADAAAALAGRGVLLDARAGERYRGETEPIDPAAGHIPGAHSAPTTETVGPDGLFRPAADLAAHFAALGATPEAEVGVYCGSGVSAAHELLALAVAGVPAALYVGSWSEWSADSGRPIATGAEPGLPVGRAAGSAADGEAPRP